MDPVLKIVLAIVIFFSALIGVVIIVGLVREELNPTGVATMLGGILTSLMGGVFVRWKNVESERKKPPEGEDNG